MEELGTHQLLWVYKRWTDLHSHIMARERNKCQASTIQQSNRQCFHSLGERTKLEGMSEELKTPAVVDFIEQHRSCLYLGLENSHQNWCKMRFSMPCFLSLRKSPRPTCLPSPSCPQGGHQIIFSEDSSILNHSRLQKLCIGLKTSSFGEAWVGWFSHVELLWSEKLILFWAVPLFSSQQKRSHNELALSRSRIWKNRLLQRKGRRELSASIIWNRAREQCHCFADSCVAVPKYFFSHSDYAS